MDPCAFFFLASHCCELSYSARLPRRTGIASCVLLLNILSFHYGANGFKMGPLTVGAPGLDHVQGFLQTLRAACNMALLNGEMSATAWPLHSHMRLISWRPKPLQPFGLKVRQPWPKVFATPETHEHALKYNLARPWGPLLGPFVGPGFPPNFPRLSRIFLKSHQTLLT